MTRPRVLVTCFPQAGHLHPLIPTARALVEAGCPLVVATSAGAREDLTAAGLETVDLGPSLADVFAQRGHAPPDASSGLRGSRRAALFSFLFGRVYAPAVADPLLACARSWRADVILASLESLAGPLVAAQLGLPLVVNGFGVGLAADVHEATAQAVAPLWARAGLAVPPYVGLFDGLFLDSCPPSLRPDDVPAAPRVQPVRPAQFDGAGASTVPTHLPGRRPLVYVTFGTNRAFVDADRLRTIAAAVAAAGGAAVITGVDPAELGTLPDGVVARRFVPQSTLLPQCDAVICHGGASTLFGALANGLPLVLMPVGADHFVNTAAAVRRGVAVALDGGADARAVETALARLLADSPMRAAAASVAAEIAAMPDASAAAAGMLAWLDARPGAR